MSTLLSALLVGWAVVVALVGAVAMFRALRYRRRREPSSAQASAPSVVVVRPCAGLEPHLRQSLLSTATLRYRGRLRLVLSTSTADDPARPLLQEVAAQLRAQGRDVEVMVIPPRGTNLKASQLAGVLETSSDDVALVIDSDVELDGLDLDRLVHPLADSEARVGAIWCPPVERAPKTLGDRMSAAVLGGSLHAFPLLGALDPRGMVGKTFAIRLDALRSVGGFGGLVQHLGEDMEMARRLAQANWSVMRSDEVVNSLASGRRPAQVLGRYARWLMVIRAQRPVLLASYPLLLVATPGLLLAGGLGLSLGLPGAGLAIVIGLAARLSVGATACLIARRNLQPSAVVLDVLLADLTLLVAFLRALGPARVRWRERSLRLGPRGLLVERG